MDTLTPQQEKSSRRQIDYGIYQNNLSARSIIDRKLRRMRQYPSESLGLELERILGIPFDYQSSDTGNEPQIHEHI